MRAERFRVVSSMDEAYDLDFNDRLVYAGTRDFESIQGRKLPGARPTIFHVREVPHGLWEEYVDAPDAYPEKYRRAFICGVERVENLVMADGVSLGTWAPNTKNTRSGAIIMGDEDLKLFAPAERAEIGSVIYTHSFLPRRMRATYLLPHSLQEPLLSQASRLVAQKLKDAEAMSSGAQSDPSTPQPPETEPKREQDDAGFGRATDVTAAIQTNP